MKYIELTQGYRAIVDDEDYEEISKRKWYAHRMGHKKYASCHQKKPMIQMHRFLLKAQKGQIIDHINGNGLDNRKENLRFCTQAENQWNVGKPKNNTSGYKGVYFHKPTKTWMAYIRCGGKTKNLGHFKDIKKAADRYNQVALQNHGEFANLNIMAI